MWGHTNAVKQIDGSIKEEAVGSKCLVHRKVHEVAFSIFAWDSFVALYHGSPEMKKAVTEAVGAVEGKPKSFVPEDAFDTSSRSGFQRRIWNIATEKEIESATKNYRLPKKMLQQLPQGWVQSELDPTQQEWAYFFRSPQYPFRQFVETVGTEQQKRRRLMEPERQLHSTQGKDIFNYFVEKDRDAKKISDIAQHSYHTLHSFESFHLALRGPAADNEALFRGFLQV